MSHRLNEVFRSRQLLADTWLFEHDGKVRSGSGFDALVRDAVVPLPPGLDPAVIARSIPELAGVRLTGVALRRAAYRLAGNVPRLREGRPVPPWTRQAFVEPVPAQVVAARPERSRRGRDGWRFSWTIFAGTPCPRTVHKWWTVRTVHYLSSSFGFSRFRGATSNVCPHPFRDPTELVTLRALLVLDPEYSDETGPGFRDVAFPSAIQRWNREQQRRRARVGPDYACPYDQPRRLPCYRCPVGYRDCRAATHEHTYESRACAACKDDAAPFDPGAELCVNCVRARFSAGT